MSIRLTRRNFLMSAGLTLAAALTPSGLRVLSAEELGKSGKDFSPNVWIQVRPDSRVVLAVNKSEMGQGVYTSLPMVLADELDADWKQVGFLSAPAGDAFKDPVWGSQATGGSTSIRHMIDSLRGAGASARAMLVSAGAKTWGVPEEECATALGRVVHGKSGRSLTYGSLSSMASGLPVPKSPRLKSADQFRYIGREMPRLDALEKVAGSARFGIDTFTDRMLYAAVIRAPVFGAKVVDFDADRALQVRNVKQVVRIDRGIAVCAGTIDAAWKGREKLSVTWDRGMDPDLATDSLHKEFMLALDQAGAVARNDGDAPAAVKAAGKKIEAIYSLPYLAHATMEPMNCTAHVREDRCDVWAATQNQTGTLMTAKRITGLPAEKIHVHTTYLGGGFGRRFEQDFVEEAVQISKITGKPAKVVWTREDDMKHDYYRPANVSRVQGGVDESGKMTAWSHKIVCPSIFARVFPDTVKDGIDNAAVEGLKNLEYEIPHIRVEYVRIDTPVPVGFWRSVGSSHNAFTVETFIDALAHAAGKDPLEFRLGHLKSEERARRVLEVAAEKAGWAKKPGEGRGLGIAYHLSFGSYVAHVAEVSVNRKSGDLRVHRIVSAVDCGAIINPDTIKAQIMGAVVMGLSAALKEKIELAKGGVATSNFDSYGLLRMSETPHIEVHIVKSGAKPGGIGEPGVPPVAPAVANALFSAAGIGMKSLPMTPGTVLEEIKKTS